MRIKPYLIKKLRQIAFIAIYLHFKFTLVESRKTQTTLKEE